jgi:hypothetical protein
MNSIVAEALEENKEYAADLITDQLTHGIKGDGEELMQYRNDEYAAFKRSIGSMSSPVADLKLSGDYHSSIKMEVGDKEGVVSSTDSKDVRLSAKYGEEIKQYTVDSKKELRLQIKPDIQIRVNDLIKK